MTSEELRNLAATLNAGNHAGTVDDPIPQQLLYTKTSEDGTKKVYTVAAGIAVGGSGAPASDATDTVKGVNKLSDAIDSDLDAATGVTAATPKAVKLALAEAKRYTDENSGGGGTMAYVLTPTITTPAHDATNVSTLPTIAASAYRNVFETDARQHRVFQVASDSGFGTLLVNQNVNADSYAVTSQLTPSTQLYCRVRDVAVSGLQSEWSNTVAFTTAAGVVANTPVVTLHGYADSPTDILSGLRITTSEYSVSGGTADAHRATSWAIAPKDGTRANVWESLEDTTNKTSITVPDGTLQKGTAYTLSVTFHGTTSFDSSPAVVEFTTSADFGTVNAPTFTVEGGPNTVYETPTLTGGAFSNTRDPDTHDMTDWRIMDATGVSEVWSSLNDGTNKNSIKVPSGRLQVSTAYKAQVRYHGAKYGWSAYTTVDFTTVAQYNVVNTPTITVQGAPSNVKETPVLTGTAFGGTNVTHKSTDWKILKADDNTEVWKSEGDISNLTTIKVPKGILKVSTAYIFKVRYNANEGVSSSWAETTATCAAEFIRYNYIGVPGTSTFGVGLTTEANYNAVQLTPADNCEVETDFQYGLYVRGSTSSVGDGVAMKWIPKFYIAPLQKNNGTVNLSDSELDNLLPYVEVTKEQMKEAQRRSPHNAMVIAPSDAFTDDSDANSHGFYFMRGFADENKVYDGFFISNTLSVYYEYSSGPAFEQRRNRRVWLGYPNKDLALSPSSYTEHLLRASTAKLNSGYGNFYGDIFGEPSAVTAKGNFVSILEGTPYQCCSIFAWAVISVLSLIQGQYATDTAQCAWYDASLATNYPKGINSATKDTDDSSVTSDTVDASQGSVFVTQGYEKTTHNGSITGITNINGWLWQFVIGSWGDGSKLLKHSASIYDVTYDNVDSSSAPFYETHNVSNVSSQWGGTKSSFPDLAGADKDLFGVYAFGGNTGQNSNEFGKDYHYRYSGYSAVIVGGGYSHGSDAGVFYRDGSDWTDASAHYGFRAMAYPRVSS